MDLGAIIQNMVQTWAETPKDLKFAFAAISVIVTAPAYHLYYKVVRESEQVPTMSNWISWLLMDLAILGGMIGAKVVLPQMIVYTLGTAWVVWGCVQRGATVGWTRMDTVCMLLVLVAIGIWRYTGDPLTAIIISSVGCFVGAIPFYLNLYRNPAKEPQQPWMYVITGSVFALLALRSWDLTSAFTPVFFLGVQALALGLTMRRYR